MKYFLLFIAAIILIVIGEIVYADLGHHFVAEGIIILITLLIVDLGYDVVKNWKRFKLYWRCKILALRKEKIRFSMSYQYRIKIKDKYLLVKNQNFGHYQFVGGKYKRLPVTQKILEDFGAVDDMKLPNSGLMKDDFALFVPAKNAINFIDWFNTRKDREISHWREFYEELVDGKAKILSAKNFPYVNYNYVKTVITPIKKTPGWNCYEILQYDVLDLLPTPAQEKELEELLLKGDSDYLKWADEELIRCLGHDNREKKLVYKIGHHAKWCLNLVWSKD